MSCRKGRVEIHPTAGLLECPEGTMYSIPAVQSPHWGAPLSESLSLQPAYLQIPFPFAPQKPAAPGPRPKSHHSMHALSPTRAPSLSMAARPS